MLKKITVTSFFSLIIIMLCCLQNGNAMDDGNSNNRIEDRLRAVEKRLDEMGDELTDTTDKFQDFFNTGIEWPMWLNIGAGIRSSFSSVEDAVDEGDDWSQNAELENMRLYIKANVTTNLRFVFNTERFNDGETQDDLRVLDAYAAVEFHDLFNVYAGRLHPPSDRTNFNGPFNLNTWQFPFVSAYPSIFAGRDEGIAIWGQLGEGKLKYQLGAFEGRDDGPNEDDDLIYSGRLTFNFWDPEPGYYNKSAYYGTKDVLAVGLVGMFQNHGAGSAADPGDFAGWSIDFLMEKKLPNNAVVNLEGAFYNYDLDGTSVAESISGGGLVNGHSWFALASYMFPWKLGWGQIQPTVRYQNFDRTQSGLGTRERWEVGANYIIKGHDARVSFLYGNEHPGRSVSVDGTVSDNENFGMFIVGLQLQR